MMIILIVIATTGYKKFIVFIKVKLHVTITYLDARGLKLKNSLW